MNDYAKTLAKMKKTSKLIRLNQRQNGPKSYKRGQGALLRELLANDGATQRALVAKLGLNGNTVGTFKPLAEADVTRILESC